MERDQAEGLRERLGSHPGSPVRVIAVTSGKGGVGKTNLAANLAVTWARQGKRVLVLDADLGLANVEILYGIKPKMHLGHLLDNPTLSLSDVLAEGPAGVRVLSAGSGVASLSSLGHPQQQRLLEAMEEVENRFDLVLVDTGAGVGETVQFFVGSAQEALLVVNPEPTALTDAYASVKVLSQQGKMSRFAVVINPAAHELQARDIFRKLSAVCAKFLQVELRYAGFIPRDDHVSRAVMAQRPLVEIFPQALASRALVHLAEFLWSQPAPRLEGGLKFLWNRLLRETSAVGS